MIVPTGNGGMIILPDSQPSKCPNCHKNENIVECCGHCGYEYPKDNGSVIGAIVFIIVIIILGLLVLWFIDDTAFDSAYLNKLMYENAKDYKLPKNVHILHNGNYYVVAKKNEHGSIEYLDHGRNSLTWMYPDINYTKFLDSANAKGAYKSMVESRFK